jgi:poly(3-hydroxyalkanoate) synthetase
MATRAKKTPTNKFFKTVDTMKEVATKTNDFALKTTEELVTEMINSAAKWQTMTAKAMKSGLKVADTQQNMVFDSLETAKGHIMNGVKRSRALFGKN